MSITVNRAQGTQASRKRRARAYRYRLTGVKSWQLYIGPVRNREEAIRALKELFGDCLAEVRVHPICDPWPKAKADLSMNDNVRIRTIT